MEQRRGTDAHTLPLESDAAGRLRILQVLDGGEVVVRQDGIGERPHMFGRLQLGGIGRQEEQMQVLRHAQPCAAVPTSAVQDEDDLPVRTCSSLVSKDSQFHFKQGDTDRRGQVKDRATRGGMDETDEVAPVVAMLGALACGDGAAGLPPQPGLPL